MDFNDPDEQWIIIDAITEDTADGRWVVNCESLMSFRQDAALDGDFWDREEDNQLFGGMFEFINATVITCGTYVRLGCGGLNFLTPNQGFAQFGYKFYVAPNGCIALISSPLSHTYCEGVEATTTNIAAPVPCVAGG